MRYFSKFPKIAYTLTESESGVPRAISRTVPNMTVSVQLNTLTDLVQTLPFFTYRIQESERPDTLAVKMYGSSEYVWMIYLANNMRDWFDWPLTDREFERYMNKKYESASGQLDGLSRSQLTTLGQRLSETQYYQVINGTRYFVNETTYELLPSDDNRGLLTVYAQETAANEKKRTIRIPRYEVIASIIDQFDKAMVS